MGINWSFLIMTKKAQIKTKNGKQTISKVRKGKRGNFETQRARENKELFLNAQV